MIIQKDSTILGSCHPPPIHTLINWLDSQKGIKHQAIHPIPTLIMWLDSQKGIANHTTHHTCIIIL